MHVSPSIFPTSISELWIRANTNGIICLANGIIRWDRMDVFDLRIQWKTTLKKYNERDSEETKFLWSFQNKMFAPILDLFWFTRSPTNSTRSHGVFPCTACAIKISLSRKTFGFLKLLHFYPHSHQSKCIWNRFQTHKCHLNGLICLSFIYTNPLNCR